MWFSGFIFCAVCLQIVAYILDSIAEVVYRVTVPILTNSEIWLRLFLVFCFLDLLQIFSVDYVFVPVIVSSFGVLTLNSI
jgi:hypothetical protein